MVAPKNFQKTKSVIRMELHTNFRMNSELIYKNLYNFEFGDDLSVFDKIIQTDEKNADEVLEIAKSIVRELL